MYKRQGNGYKASLHTHPIELVALTHHRPFLEKDVLTRMLWSMIPETRAFCPKGLGIIPYEMPSSTALADATVAQLDEYDVVMWEKHGVCAVGPDIGEAFDQVDVLNKAALIYEASRNMGFVPEGMSDEQMNELKEAFNLLILFYVKTEFRNGTIFLARSQYRARKTWLIRAVGKVDGLHEHSTEFLDRPVFPFICAVETPSRECEQCRLGGPCLHSATGFAVIKVRSLSQCPVPIPDCPAS